MISYFYCFPLLSQVHIETAKCLVGRGKKELLSIDRELVKTKSDQLDEVGEGFMKTIDGRISDLMLNLDFIRTITEVFMLILILDDCGVAYTALTTYSSCSG